MTKTERAEQAYNAAKDAAELRHSQALGAAWKVRSVAARRAAEKAADDQLAADYRAAQDLCIQMENAPEPHWGDTQWARDNVGLD